MNNKKFQQNSDTCNCNRNRNRNRNTDPYDDWDDALIYILTFCGAIMLLVVFGALAATT